MRPVPRRLRHPEMHTLRSLPVRPRAQRRIAGVFAEGVDRAATSALANEGFAGDKEMDAAEDRKCRPPEVAALDPVPCVDQVVYSALMRTYS